jgi:hypothetical protein
VIFLIEIDEGKLLRGKQIVLENVGILKPITVDEIIDIGYKNYYKYLSFLVFEIDDLQIDALEKQKMIKENISIFDIIISSCLHNEEYKKITLDALSFFFHEPVYMLDNTALFYLGKIDECHFIHRENYDDFKMILKLQNYLISNDVLDENPKDERTRILLEKRRKAREKLAKAKAKENNEDVDNITFADLVSIMCANANGINHENVWSMNYYMFQNQFQRMKLINDFDINIRSILAGANPDKIDMKHFISHL